MIYIGPDQDGKEVQVAFSNDQCHWQAARFVRAPQKYVYLNNEINIRNVTQKCVTIVD